MYVFISGTRPERIKLEPIYRALRERQVPFIDLHTGQHTTLIHGLSRPDVDLGIASHGDPEEYLSRLVPALVSWLGQSPAAIAAIVVQGDTASALAGAKAASQHEMRICHVEAGVRTGDLQDPWPEEGFRTEIAKLASWHYAVSDVHAASLYKEGVPVSRVMVTGNTVVDALGPRRERPRAHGLVTLHRRESFGDPLRETVAQVYRVARDVAFNIYWPLHPNPAVAVALAEQDKLPPGNLILVPAMEREHFLAMLDSAHFVITDSGGVQEEAALWGIPCIVARRRTDRMETVNSGHAYLLGQNSPEMIPAFCKDALKAGPLPRFDGYDAPEGISGSRSPTGHIVDHLLSLRPQSLATELLGL